MAVTPTATYPVSLTSVTTTGSKTMVSASFTPLANEFLVVKVATNGTNMTITSVSGGGLTWSKSTSIATSGSPGAIFVATVGATSPGAMTVTVTMNAAQTGGAAFGSVTRWPAGCSLGVVGTAVAANTTCSNTITPATTGSAVSAMIGDFNAVGSGTGTAPTRTYRASGSTEESFQRTSASGVLVYEAIYFPTATAGSAVTYGMSAPTGQSASLLAIEIKPPASSYTGATVALASSTATTVSANAAQVSATKPAGSGADAEPSAYNFSGGSGSHNRVTVLRFTGVDPTTPFVAPPTFGGNTATTATAQTAPAATWAQGDMLACCWGTYSSSTYTTPSGMTLAGVSPSSTAAEHLAAVLAWTSGTASPVETATRAAASRWLSASVAVNAAATPAAGVELLVAFQTIDSDSPASAMAAPPNWTLLASQANASGASECHMAIYYKYVYPSGYNSAQWALDSGPAATSTTNTQAGMQDDGGQQREIADLTGATPGTFGDTSTPWPLPMVAAPGGRPGTAMLTWVPANYVRVESMPNHADFGNGDNFYFSQAFYLGADFPLFGTTVDTWTCIEQQRQLDTNGSPGLEFQIYGGQLHLNGGYGVAGSNPATQYSYDTAILNLAVQQWYSLVYRLTFSTAANTSTTDVWVNGTQLVTNFVVPPPTVIGGRTYRKVGIYHNKDLPGCSLFQAGVAFGKTYASVDPTLTLSQAPKRSAAPVFF